MNLATQFRHHINDDEDDLQVLLANSSQKDIDIYLYKKGSHLLFPSTVMTTVMIVSSEITQHAARMSSELKLSYMELASSGASYHCS